MVGEVKARSGPAQENIAVFSLSEGHVVRVGRRRAGWLKVSLPNGYTGWVRSAEVEEI